MNIKLSKEAATLARIIKEARDIAETSNAAARKRRDSIGAIKSTAAFNQCGVIAELFASRTDCNKGVFMAACGIDTEEVKK